MVGALSAQLMVVVMEGVGGEREVEDQDGWRCQDISFRRFRNLELVLIIDTSIPMH